MNISFVLANRTQIDPTVDLAKLKELGSFWGGWQTWRSCQTDNVICHDMAKANELIQRDFQHICNLYVPNTVFVTLGRPEGVKIYEGDFVHDLHNHEDIVAMHLAITHSDIVLLLGFDFGEFEKNPDQMAEHRAHNYRSLTRQVILDNKNIQWIVVDHPEPFRKDLLDLPNLDRDTLSNILIM